MEKKKFKHKGTVITLSIIGTFVLAICISFFTYVSIYYKPTDNCLTYLKDSDYSTVKEEKKCIVFSPKKEVENSSGIIFYPGGKVDYRSYAHLLRDLSDNGISSVLIKMPFNLAVFNINAANDKKDFLPNVTNWYIGGHSLGGSMASSYLNKHYEEYKGLILLASYSTVDLSTYSNLKTLSLLASEDKVLKIDKYSVNKSNLPNLTEYTIERGNHSYFGDYGLMSNDGEPSITVNEQTKIVKDKIVDFIND